MSAEALLAAAYAVFLALIALGIDLLARHSHQRTGRYRTAGFEYHEGLDAWLCPEGQHLHRVGTDHVAGVARYRGKAHICNACPSKGECTDSDRGREISRAIDPWPNSEAGRFHRGIAVVLLCLAALIVGLALVRNHDPGDVALLGGLGIIIIASVVRLGAVFRRTPSGFPGEPDERGLPTQVSGGYRGRTESG